jgi:hypothetical protein
MLLSLQETASRVRTQPGKRHAHSTIATLILDSSFNEQSSMYLNMHTWGYEYSIDKRRRFTITESERTWEIRGTIMYRYVVAS